MNKKEQFKLALIGWHFKGTLDEWCFGPSDFPTASRPQPLPAPYHGIVDGILRTMIPSNVIENKRTTDEGTFIFLNDGSYYKLGNKRNG